MLSSSSFEECQLLRKNQQNFWNQMKMTVLNIGSQIVHEDAQLCTSSEPRRRTLTKFIFKVVNREEQ